MSLPKFYYTISGDMFDLISYKLYNTEYYSDQLQYANPSYANAWQFDAGVKLIVPAIVSSTPNNTPPWLTIA